MAPRAEAFRRALLASVGRSERSGAAERLRLRWRAGISWEAVLAGCPEGARLLRRRPAALGRRLRGLAEGEALDAALLTGAGIAWLGPESGGVSLSGPAELMPPPERLAVALAAAAARDRAAVSAAGGVADAGGAGKVLGSGDAGAVGLGSGRRPSPLTGGGLGA